MDRFEAEKRRMELTQKTAITKSSSFPIPTDDNNNNNNNNNNNRSKRYIIDPVELEVDKRDSNRSSSPFESR